MPLRAPLPPTGYIRPGRRHWGGFPPQPSSACVAPHVRAAAVVPSLNRRSVGFATGTPSDAGAVGWGGPRDSTPESSPGGFGAPPPPSHSALRKAAGNRPAATATAPRAVWRSRGAETDHVVGGARVPMEQWSSQKATQPCTVVFEGRSSAPASGSSCAESRQTDRHEGEPAIRSIPVAHRTLGPSFWPNEMRVLCATGQGRVARHWAAASWPLPDVSERPRSDVSVRYKRTAH